MFFKAEGLTQPAALVPTFACKISGTINAFLYGVRHVNEDTNFLKVHSTLYKYYGIVVSTYSRISI